MLDTWLAARLVAAVPERARLVLVGDADQLPSVGSGDVLRDVVRSGAVPVAELREVHRQAADVARRAPRTLAALKEIRGIGDTKAGSFGQDLLAVVSGDDA